MQNISKMWSYNDQNIGPARLSILPEKSFLFFACYQKSFLPKLLQPHTSLLVLHCTLQNSIAKRYVLSFVIVTAH